MIDWEAIKQEYITTKTSYRRLGDKYGIHFKRIARVAKRESWVEARRIWTLASAAGDGDGSPEAPLPALRQAAGNLSALLEQITGHADVFYSAGELNARTMQQTVSALKDLTAIARNLYDSPAAREAEAAESARCGVVEIGRVVSEEGKDEAVKTPCRQAQ